MSSDSPSAEREELSPDTVVYRAILRKTQIDESKIPPRPTPDLFIPKMGKDDDGLSLGLASAFTPQQFAATFNKCHGVVRLTVKDIRELGLEVRIDPEDETHILIKGIPYREDDLDAAETFAGDLRDRAFGFERT